MGYQATKYLQLLSVKSNTSTNVFKEQRDPVTIGEKNLADQDNSVTNSRKTSALKLTYRYRYNISDKTNVRTQDILEFVPLTTIKKGKKQPSDLIANEISPPENHSGYSNKKKKVTLYGAKPSTALFPAEKATMLQLLLKTLSRKSMKRNN